MARPIRLTEPIHDPLREPVEEIETASARHAEALLEVYEVLQQMRDSGILAVARGALGAGEKLVNMATDAMDSPQSVAAMRNLILLGKMLSDIDPRVMRGVAKAVDESMSKRAAIGEPESFVSLLGQLRQKDARRGLAVIVHFLEVLGREFSSLPVTNDAAPPPRRAA